MADQPKYPTRGSHFGIRVCRLLHKTCAAQEIGPIGTLLVTFVALQEDACRYKKPVTFYDGQLMPILGATSQATITAARKKAVEAGWLVYIRGWKGKASTYWVAIPTGANGLEDAPITEDIDPGFDLNAIQKMNRNAIESRSNQDRNAIESRSKVDGYLPIPNPTPNPLLPQGNENEFDGSPEAAYAQAHGIDWLKAKADFLDRWNKTPNAATCTRMTFRAERDFMARYLTEGWLDQATRAMSDKIPSAWRPIRLAEFLQEGRVEEILSGAEDKRGGRPGASHPLEKSGVGTWLAKKLAQQAEERAKAEATKGGAQ